MAFFIRPITAITTPPPTPPPARLPNMLLMSILVEASAASAPLKPSIPRMLPPSPPPKIPATEFHNVPNDEFFISEPATFPPTAPLTS